MNLTRYTYIGTFDSKEDAMVFRNENHRWCSCHTEADGDKVKLWVKLPK